ncbi:hypothetical protein [Kribbella sp. NPDC004536]|uniref:hypothetical protein n=1 Tax=Kribbella sp. NPDC004536 TaxID=3364106 RepID=UPI0036996815
MPSPYDFESASEAERAAYDQGAEDALNPSRWTEEDLVIALAACADAAGRQYRERRQQAQQ